MRGRAAGVGGRQERAAASRKREQHGRPRRVRGLCGQGRDGRRARERASMSGVPGSGVALAAAAFSSVLFAVVAMAIGVAVLYWGYWIAKQRGYSAWLGLALAFFLGLIGIIILYVLPTKRPAAPRPRADGYNQYPPPPGSVPGRPPAPSSWSTVGPPPPWAARAEQGPVSPVPEVPPASPSAPPSAPSSAMPSAPPPPESPPPPGDRED